jgi:hypothetical protein
MLVVLHISVQPYGDCAHVGNTANFAGAENEVSCIREKDKSQNSQNGGYGKNLEKSKTRSVVSSNA